MSDGMMKNWGEYKPTKTVWAWSCIGAAALTMIIGFTAGGWVTGGTATARVEASTGQAVATLAANICAHQFRYAANVGVKPAPLKATDPWKRTLLIDTLGEV